MIRFELKARDGKARRGRLTTGHGTVETPAFMTVGTAGTVKGILPEQLIAAGAEVVLGNTYHLMLRPGAERIARLGGLHHFMNWPRTILTDSGGFQAMSLAKLRAIDEDGITFQSHLDGSRWRLTPEDAMRIQGQLGSDLQMVLDECTAYPVSEADAASSMRRSMRWAARSKAAFQGREGQGVLGIVQGSVYPALRQESAAALREIGFDGYAIGGLAVGEGQARMLAVLDALDGHLPEDRPRYLMGVGTPDDIVEAVLRGIDMFDCVLPTRSGRTGRAYTSTGTLNIRNARHQDDPAPIDNTCCCPVCRDYSRAYLHHLFRCGEMLGPILLTLHNLHLYQTLMARLRQAIEQACLAAEAASILAAYRSAPEAEAEPEEGLAGRADS
ncbi:MAG: tRNA guanosine(34) transglycosylase Tgt [Alphaproteobacteria bacterium]|nr:tRNA guanosine(34) transglycosylase Tgt [Alphaproteobacteria bacterium]